MAAREDAQDTGSQHWQHTDVCARHAPRALLANCVAQSGCSRREAPVPGICCTRFWLGGASLTPFKHTLEILTEFQELHVSVRHFAQ